MPSANLPSNPYPLTMLSRRSLQERPNHQPDIAPHHTPDQKTNHDILPSKKQGPRQSPVTDATRVRP